MMAQCTAHSKQSGQQCKRSATPGATVCSKHGGNAPQVQAAARRRLEDAKAASVAARFVTRRDIHPAEALLELVQWTAGEVDYWRARVGGLSDEDLAGDLVTKREAELEKGQPTDLVTREAAQHVAVRMLADASDRLAKYAAAALRAGIEERRVRLAEGQGALVAAVIRRVLDALELSPAQLEQVPVVVPRELRALAAGQEAEA